MIAPTNPSTNPWRSGWFFVGLADSLDEDGAHLTLDLPDLSITIQNFRGALAGFWNVCSHRGVQMRACGRGRGLLRCPYHGWTYNRAGIPVGIPQNERLFGLNRDQKRALALCAINVAAAGPFLFARIDRSSTDLATGIGSLASKIQGWTLRHAWCVAERESRRDVPWRSVLDDWGDIGVAGHVFIPPNLIIDREGDWTLLRSCIALAPAATRLLAAIYHPDRPPLGTAPPRLRESWLAATSPRRTAAASEI